MHDSAEGVNSYESQRLNFAEPKIAPTRRKAWCAGLA